MEIKPSGLDYRDLNALPVLTMANVEKLIIHHMGNDGSMQAQHNYHKNNLGWNGLGYNYFIDFDGTIYETRGLRQGAHSGEWNSKSLGIGLRGNFETGKPTPEQMKSTAWLCDKLIKDSSRLKTADIVGHNAVSSTLCPGKNFDFVELVGLIGELNKPSKLYRVQVGAFRSRENAVRQRDKLRSEGYKDAFIVD